MRNLRQVCGDFDPKTQTYEVRTIPGPMEAKARFRIDEHGRNVRAGWSMFFACHACLGSIEVAWEEVFGRHDPGHDALVALSESAQREVARIRDDARYQVQRLEELLNPPLSAWESICASNRKAVGEPGFVAPRWDRGWMPKGAQ
jgi:hypothetical protein